MYCRHFIGDFFSFFCIAQHLAKTASNAKEYGKILNEEMQGNLFNLCIFSLVAITWTIFVRFYSSNKWRYMPHAQTMLLLVFQAIQCIGVLLYSWLDFSMKWAKYFQVIVLAVGSYGSRINVCIIALSMLLLTYGKSRLISKFQIPLLAIGSIMPLLIVAGLAFGVPDKIHGAHYTKVHTDMTFGFSQTITTVVIYGISQVLVVLCLILSQMHYKKNKPGPRTGRDTASSKKIKNGQSILAFERHTSNIIGFNSIIPEGATLEDCCQWKDGRKRSKDERDCQMVRHTVLLIYQAVLMFVGKPKPNLKYF